MHYTIGAIVYADSREDVENLAGDVFEKLVGDAGPFDYFTIFKDGISRASSKKGTKDVKMLMDFNREEFIDNLGKLRTALGQMTDEAAFSRHGEFDVRYMAYQIGKYVGGGIYLYDSDGGGIRTPEDLQRALTKKDHQEPKGVFDWFPGDAEPTVASDAWIVLADAHS